LGLSSLVTCEFSLFYSHDTRMHAAAGTAEGLRAISSVIGILCCVLAVPMLLDKLNHDYHFLAISTFPPIIAIALEGANCLFLGFAAQTPRWSY